MSRRIRPRHQPAADMLFPPECRDMIRRGALVAINHSGGKDSQVAPRTPRSAADAGKTDRTVVRAVAAASIRHEGRAVPVIAAS